MILDQHGDQRSQIFRSIVLISSLQELNMKYLQITLLLLVMTLEIGAQDLGFGVKAGLSFSTVSGPTNGSESFGYKSGFHVGPTISLKYTDNFGVRFELLYNQLGTDYDFEGESFFVLRNETGTEIVRGDKELSLTSYLNYLDIPVQAYYRFGEVVEVFGGVNLLALLGGTGGGQVNFRSDRLLPENIEASLDYSYNSDDAGSSPGSGGTTHAYRRTDYEVPGALGAYYEHDDKDGRAWNTLDYGLHGGLRIFFNEALYLEGRAYYGFGDVSNDKMDLIQLSPAGSPLREFSDDDDRNIAFGVSLGFSF